MVEVTFRYIDRLSRGQWKKQHCIVEDVDECIRIYGLDEDDVSYEIIEVNEI